MSTVLLSFLNRLYVSSTALPNPKQNQSSQNSAFTIKEENIKVEKDACTCVHTWTFEGSDLFKKNEKQYASH